MRLSASIQFKDVVFTGGAYTLLQEDVNQTLSVDETADVTITVPSLTMVEGDFINIKQKGEGAIQFVADTGVTILSEGDVKKTNGKGSYVSLVKTADGYDLVGALESSVGGSYISVTKTELDALITDDALQIGMLYRITGVHPALYDDGTTSGTTIFLKAATSNKLETQGHGLFYNPKYDQSVEGFGVWTDLMSGTFSSISGNFDVLNKETVTANNGATGLIYAKGLIQWVSGDWSAATSITGATSGATATVSGFSSPSYSIGDKVFWGQYVWQNVNGNVGAKTDILNLDAEWTKLPYDTVNYKVAIDVIGYDYANDMIVMRHELEADNIVTATKGDVDTWINDFGFYNPISVFMWGNAFDYNSYKGIGGNKVYNSYFENTDFLGSKIQNNTLSGSNIYNNTLSSSDISYNTLSSSGIQNNTLSSTSSIASNALISNSYIQGNTLSGKSYIQSNTLSSNGNIQDNTVSGYSGIQNNTLSSTSNIASNMLNSSSYIQNNILGSSSFIRYNTLSSSGNIQDNTVGRGGIQNNTVSSDSYIQNNTLQNNFLTLSYIQNNTLQNNAYLEIGLANPIIGKTIQKNTFISTTAFNVGMSGATIIYGDYEKTFYKRPNGTNKVRYYNDSDVLVIGNITD